MNNSFINKRILEAYDKIYTHKEITYHWTNSNPDEILEKGFDSKMGICNGQTYMNRLGFLYEENIPFKNLLFVSSNPKEFSRDGKYCLKIDITGLDKYPDYNHLLDFGVYYNDDDGRLWLNRDNMWRGDNEDLKEFFAENDDNIDISNFSGLDSWELIN